MKKLFLTFSVLYFGLTYAPSAFADPYQQTSVNCSIDNPTQTTLINTHTVFNLSCPQMSIPENSAITSVEIEYHYSFSNSVINQEINIGDFCDSQLGWKTRAYTNPLSGSNVYRSESLISDNFNSGCLSDMFTGTLKFWEKANSQQFTLNDFSVIATYVPPTNFESGESSIECSISSNGSGQYYEGTWKSILVSCPSFNLPENSAITKLDAQVHYDISNVDFSSTRAHDVYFYLPISSPCSYYTFGPRRNDLDSGSNILKNYSLTIDQHPISNSCNGYWEFVTNASGNYTLRDFLLTAKYITAFDITPTPTPIPTYTVNGNVYVDVNQNGFQDEGELGFEGAVVNLNEEQETTNVDGEYSFPDLIAGIYSETLEVPSGYSVTTTNPVEIVVTADTTQNFGIVPLPTPTPTLEPTPTPSSLSPVADTYIKQGSQNENEGSSTFVRLQSSGHNRALLKFDQFQIQTAVGSSQAYTAKLILTITDNGDNWGTEGRTIEIHRLLKDWAEGNGFIVDNHPTDRGTGQGTTWNCAVDTNIANQNDDCTGDTVWNMDNSSLWPFLTTTTDTQTIHTDQTGTIEFDVTEDVQTFIEGSTQNYGWLIKKTDEGQNGRVEFGTKESFNSPVLVITQI